MDHDDDVEHLFSWLQTPELRYREFAGAREITDAIVTQARPRPAETPVAPPGDTQLQEEYPAGQFPDQRDAPEDVVRRAPEVLAPTPDAPRAASVPIEPPPPIPPMPRSPVVEEAPASFALGSEGRGSLRRPHYEEPVAPLPVGTAGTRPMPPPPPPPPPVATGGPSQTSPRPASAGGGLLGGAYRDEGVNGHGGQPVAPDSAAAAPRNEHSLDAVFGRLAAGRHRAADPRERLRHIPGLGPPTNRSR